MQIDYIKVPIPKEIDERGGAAIRLVNLLTVALGDSIKEAVQGGYVIGDAVLVTKQFQGLLKSMVEGLERDGMSRQIGDYITLYPKFLGPVDLDKGYDPKVNQIKLGVRILGSEYEIDTKNLTFRDVTSGKLSFSVDYASSGDDTKKVDFSKEIKITGRDFPKKEELRLRVEVPELGLKTFVDPEKFTGSVTVLTIEEGALMEVFDNPAINGKKVVFTVLGGFNNASCSAIIDDGSDKSPALTSFVQLNQAGVVEAVGKMITIYDMIEVKGKNLPEGIKGRYALYDKDSGELKTATEWEANPSHTMFERVSSTTVRAQFKVNATPYPDGMWLDEGHPIKYEVKLPDESIISIDLPLV